MGGLSERASAREAGLRLAIAGGTEAERTELNKLLSDLQELKLTVLDSANPSADASAPADVVLSFVKDPDGYRDILGEWAESTPKPFMIALVPGRSVELARSALRAGANDVLHWPADRSEILFHFIKLNESRSGAGRPRRCATVSLASVSGGTGVSSLTVALGCEIRRQTNKKVALIDLGFQTNSLTSLLDLDPDHSITELADPTIVIDSIRLESVFCTHPSGLHVLAAPRRIEEGELVSPGTVGSALEVMGELFDFVLIDCGHHLSETAVAAWERSDHLLYVVTQSVTSVRPAQRFLDLFDRLHLSGVRPEFVLNAFKEDHPITREKVEAALRHPMLTSITYDDDAFTQAQINATDVGSIAPLSPAHQSIQKLAARISGVSGYVAPPTGTGLISALRSALGYREN